MIAKDLFLVETFIAMGCYFLRDHENRPVEYPGGYPFEGAASSAPRSFPGFCPPGNSDAYPQPAIYRFSRCGGTTGG
jgi:hypothetical protein